MNRPNDKELRQQLKQACAFFGGITPLANKAGIDPGNLSRWFNGKPSFSEDRVSLALNALGLTNSIPDASIVHSWKIKRVFFKDFTPALRLYFPNDAQICRAPWVVPGPSLKDTFSRGEDPNTLYAITDGTVRAVLRMPRQLLIQKENIQSLLTWKNGTQKNSVLNIPTITNKWKTGVPTISQFDAAWGGSAPTLTESDVLDALRESGISYEDAIAVIKSTASKSYKP